MIVQKLVSMIDEDTCEEKHVFLEKFWNYWEKEWKYCTVTIGKNSFGSVIRQEKWLEI